MCRHLVSQMDDSDVRIISQWTFIHDKGDGAYIVQVNVLTHISKNEIGVISQRLEMDHDCLCCNLKCVLFIYGEN